MLVADIIITKIKLSEMRNNKVRRLGISVYPNHSELNEIKEYIVLAAKYNFKRIFTCLLSVEEGKEKIVAEFTEIIEFAKENGMARQSHRPCFNLRPSRFGHVCTNPSGFTCTR